MNYSANELASSSSAESPPTQTNPEPRTRKGRKHKDGPKTAQDYLPLFRRVIKAYIECLSYTGWSSYAEGYDPHWASSRVVAASRYVVDIERSASQMLDTVPLWFAWGNLVRRYGGLGFYEHVPEEIEQDIIVTVGREWERLGLHRIHQYFNRQIVDQNEPLQPLGKANGRSGPVAGSGVGSSEATAVPCMQQGVERRCKSNQEVNAKR